MLERLKTFIRTPPGVLGTVMLGTVCVVCTYKMIIRPELKRRAQAESNQYAEFLFQKEMNLKERQTDINN